MRQRSLVKEMDMCEVVEWMAYDMACDEEFREKTLIEQSLKAQENNTPEQEAQLVRDMFMRMANAAN
jgi:hypothetical protein